MCFTHAMDEAPIAGRYRLLDRHATGGLATVWRARDEWTGEIVAIKRLHPHVVADAAARARLAREAAALRAVDHLAIVRPRELIEDVEAPSLVMDFVAGRSLSELIAAGPLVPEEAAAIAGVIADALAVVHDHGIVHRDIKPANILIGDDGSVHLVDFGIAALLDTAPDDLTAASTMVGTLRYAAPERLAGGDVSARSDVWALGAVLYEMLTGRPAVSNDDPASALAASRAAPPSLAGLPAGLAAVVARAMTPEPADRYPDAIAMRDALALQDVRGDPDGLTTVMPIPVIASADPRFARLGQHEPRRRIGLVGGGLIAVAALLALAGSTMLAGIGPGKGSGAAVVPVSTGPTRSTTASPSTRAGAAATVQPTTTPGSANVRGKGKHRGR